MSNYSEKLKDPRWQKKRLSILDRAKWKCECCDDDKESLQVHHLIYSKGEPWDAPDETLECLCESCHEAREEFNELCGGRTEVPTRLCYAFVRFCGKLYKKRNPMPLNWTPLKEFAVFWDCLKDPVNK